MLRNLAGTFAASTIIAASASCSGAGTDLYRLDSPDASKDASSESSVNPPPTHVTDPFEGGPPYTKGSGGDPSCPHFDGACAQSGCHGPDGEGDPLFIGGRVYADYFAKTPAAGVEVRVVDGAGHSVSTYSNECGIFHVWADSTQGVSFPAHVGIRNATSDRPMVTPLTGTMGSCDQSACHTPAGKSGGSYYPIHLP